MRINGGILIYDTKPCLCTDDGRPGQVQGLRRCRFYGRPVRGRFPADRCPDCGAKRRHDHNECVPTGVWRICGRCNGAGVVQEDRCDYMPQELMYAIPLRLFRLDGDVKSRQLLLGVGCLWACYDQGRAARRSNGEVLDRVGVELLHRSVRAGDVVDALDRLPPAIGVFVHEDGYAVRALTPDRLAKMAREYGYDAGVGG